MLLEKMINVSRDQRKKKKAKIICLHSYYLFMHDEKATKPLEKRRKQNSTTSESFDWLLFYHSNPNQTYNPFIDPLLHSLETATQ